MIPIRKKISDNLTSGAVTTIFPSVSGPAGSKKNKDLLQVS